MCKCVRGWAKIGESVAKRKRLTGFDQGQMMTFSMMVLFSVHNNNQTKCQWATSHTWKAIQAWANLGFYQAPGS